MMMDVMAGIILLTALAGALAVATNLRQRNAQHLIDQRAAMRIAQDALAAGQAPENSPAKVSVARTGKLPAALPRPIPSESRQCRWQSDLFASGTSATPPACVPRLDNSSTWLTRRRVHE